MATDYHGKIERLRAEVERLTKAAEDNYQLAIKEATRAEDAERRVEKLRDLLRHANEYVWVVNRSEAYRIDTTLAETENG